MASNWKFIDLSDNFIDYIEPEFENYKQVNIKKLLFEISQMDPGV